MDIFEINKEFPDWECVLNAKKKYQESSKSVLTISSSHKLKGSNDFVEKFVYDRVTLSCKAGLERKSKSNGYRKSSTYKKNCPAEIGLNLKNNKFIVTKLNLNHENHMTDQQTYEYYPENVRLNATETKKAEEMISAGANKKILKIQLMNDRGGKPVLLKGLHNIQTKLRKYVDSGTSDLATLYDILAVIEGANVRFISNHEDELVGIFFQNRRMVQIYAKYPEVILYDATYKLNNHNLPLFIQCCIDGNGNTEIASLYICKSESKESIGPMLDTFKEFNPNWTKTEVFVGDKDFADRNVYKEKFPDSVLQICLYHVMTTLNREITTEKRKITADQRRQALEILQRLVYSQSNDMYDKYYADLCSLNLTHVTAYFNECWHNIKDEWTMFGRNNAANLMNTTNNRTERLNRTLKAIGNRYANLIVFFGNISTSVAVISSERDIAAVRGTMRVERIQFDDPVLKRYHELLTPFIYEKISFQHALAEKVKLSAKSNTVFESQSGYLVTSDSCTCNFFCSMKLLCRHIFAVLRRSDEDLYVPELCSLRWTKEYFNRSHPALSSSEQMRAPQPMSVKKIRAPDEITKYKKTATITKSINEASSTMGHARYNYFMEKLTDLRDEIFGESIHANSTRNTQPQIIASTQPTSSLEMVPNASTAFVPTTVASMVNIAPSTVTPCSVSNIAILKLPSKINPIGRPKGLGQTVIGLKKKSKTQPTKDVKRQRIQSTNQVKKKFLDLNFVDQSITIVGWLTNMPADQILKKKITIHDLHHNSNVFNRLRNDAIDLTGIKQYLNSACYSYVTKLIDKLEGTRWPCMKCLKNLSGDQVMCNACLDWYHISCAGYKNSQSNIVHYCVHCCIKCSLIQL